MTVEEIKLNVESVKDQKSDDAIAEMIIESKSQAYAQCKVAFSNNDKNKEEALNEQ